MWWVIPLLLASLSSFTERRAALAEGGSVAAETAGPSHFQPMVALLCNPGTSTAYHSQYLAENRRWTSDPDSTVSLCSKDKLDILEYCRKVYPKRDIRNIVESSRYYKIDGWCKVGQKKCKASHWVKPYRCLEGPFQSDALLVPEHCLFDHIHNQSVCQSFDEWNGTASRSCAERNLALRSFAMLLPCGVDIFSGVEFVCCPAPTTAQTTAAQSPPETVKSKNEVVPPVENEVEREEVATSEDDGKEDRDDERGEDEDYDDDYYDDDDDEQKSSSSTSTTTTTTTTTTEKPIDHYFSHFDSKHEHENFKEAQKYLEESHREKVTKVMKEWSELEERYQDMKIKDPKAAEDFRKKMSAHFQKTVEALEDEGATEKRHLSSMHQQRVMTIINIRKKSAMDCYTAALDKIPYNMKKIEKCLEKLLRALEKDRSHTLHHYRHVAGANPGGQAREEREALLRHLEDLTHIANQSIAMLDRLPSVADKIRDRMVSIWFRLNGDTSGSRLVDEAILEEYKKESTVKQKIPTYEAVAEEIPTAATTEINSSSSTISVDSTTRTSQTNPVEDIQYEHEELPVPKVAHAQSQMAHHNEVISKTFSIRKEERFRWNGSIYITLAFAGMALLTALAVGVVLLRRHAAHRPPHGFVEVEQAPPPLDPDQRHMQVNGYENPTYKYFEQHTKA